jgi:hypothetical protein
MPPDAKQFLLEIAVRDERARIHDPINPSVDHDRH